MITLYNSLQRIIFHNGNANAPNLHRTDGADLGDGKGRRVQRAADLQRGCHRHSDPGRLLWAGHLPSWLSGGIPYLHDYDICRNADGPLLVLLIEEIKMNRKI